MVCAAYQQKHFAGVCPRWPSWQRILTRRVPKYRSNHVILQFSIIGFLPSSQQLPQAMWRTAYRCRRPPTVDRGCVCKIGRLSLYKSLAILSFEIRRQLTLPTKSSANIRDKKTHRWFSFAKFTDETKKKTYPFKLSHPPELAVLILSSFFSIHPRHNVVIISCFARCTDDFCDWRIAELIRVHACWI